MLNGGIDYSIQQENVTDQDAYTHVLYMHQVYVNIFRFDSLKYIECIWVF